MRILPIVIKDKWKILNRFESKCMPEPNTGCWIWTEFLDSGGYGRMLINRSSRIAHRISYTLYKGDIPYGVLVCHVCDNRWCVNPDHLFLGTHSDNINDCYRKGRVNRKGELGSSKLTDEQARFILHSDIKPHRLLADMFSVSLKTIRSIKYRHGWKHI